MKPPAPSAHHEFSPSSWPMWSKCPCYESTGKSLEDIDAELLASTEDKEEEPDDPGAQNKARGTLQHAALASIYSNDTEARTAAFAVLTEAEAEQVRWVAGKANEIAESLGYQPHEFRPEVRVTMYKGESLEILYFGTVDLGLGPTIIMDAKMGLVRDYFTQLVGYMLPKLVDSGHRVGRAYTLYGRAKRVTENVIDLETAETVAYAVLSRRQDPGRKPTLCEYCGWCAHRGTCEATTAVVSAIAYRREDWALKLPKLRSADMLNDPLACGAALYAWKAYVKEWGGGMEFIGRSLAERNMVPVGFRKQVEKGRVKIADPCAAFELLREAGVTDAALAEIPVSMTDLVRAAMKSFGLGETAAKTKILSILEGRGVLSQGDASFKLVRVKGGEELIRAQLAIRAQASLTNECSAP